MWKTADEVTSSYACIAGSKQHIDNANTEANSYIGIYLWSSPVPVLDYIISKNVKLVTLWRYHRNISVWRNNNDSVQMKSITRELDIRRHIYDSFFVVAIKINSFTTLACYAICCKVQVCQRFERRLKRLALFLFIFGKDASLGWFFCSNSQGNFESGSLRLSIIQIFCMWAESSVRCILSATF